MSQLPSRSSFFLKGFLGLFILLSLAAFLLINLPLHAQVVNIVANPSFETGAIDPDGWLRGGYGTNNATFTYPSVGQGGGRAATVAITSYTDGDVKWYFALVPVSAGKQYFYTDDYRSGATTQITAEYVDVNRQHLSYGGFFQLQASGLSGSEWASSSVTFIPPAGAAFMTVFHSLQSIGSLTIDNVSLSDGTTLPPPPPPDNTNLIGNPSLETVGAGGDPERWFRGGYGMNDGSFTYPIIGADGGKAASVAITSYTDGDVKWFFAPVSVVVGKHYSFTEDYRSVATTALAAEYFDANHTHLSYGGFASVPPTGVSTWGKVSVTFVPPIGAAYMTVFHSLPGVGSLATDNANLKEITLPPGATLNTMLTVSGGTLRSADFQVSVIQPNVTTIQFPGSVSGTPVIIQPGVSYTVTAVNAAGYSIARSAGCAGVLPDRGSATCMINETFGTSTILNVETQVVNTHGGTNVAADFIINVTGASASPSFFRGSSAGTVVSVAPSAPYSVMVTPSDSYVSTLSPDCKGSVVLGDRVTCTITLADKEQVVEGATPLNLIANPTLQKVTPGDPTLPDSWTKGVQWGTQVPIYEYPVEVASSSDITVGNAARVSFPTYTDTVNGGDAKWAFAPVGVTPGRRYVFQDAYIADTTTLIVGEYFDAAHAHLSYVGFFSLPETPTNVWKIGSASFTAPAGAAYVTIYHLINSQGSLTVNNFTFSEVPLPTPFASGFVSLTFDDGFLNHYTFAKNILDSAGEKGTFYVVSHNSGFGITNASLEAADSATSSRPLGWKSSGSANASYVYPVSGRTGLAAEVSSAQEGSHAAWYYDPVSIFSDESNQFSHYYKSTTDTDVYIQVTAASGTLEYIDPSGVLVDTKTRYAALPPAANWTQFQTPAIWLPPRSKNVTVLHSLSGAGTLDIDDAQVGAYVDYMTPDEVRVMQSAGHEIGGHTQTHADLLQLGQVDATKEISGGRQELISGNLSPVLSFAYPYGNNNSDTQQIAKTAGYTSARGVIDGYNGKNANKYNLFSKSVNADTTLADIEGWINKAFADHSWLILAFHQIEPNITERPEFAYGTTPDMLTNIVNYLKVNNLPVVTVKDGVSMMDLPTITVMTTVTNTHGGTRVPADFFVTITGSSGFEASFMGSASGTAVTINSGMYAVSVSPALANYNIAFSAGCSGNLGLNQSASCIVSITDK